ncbi:Hypothetical protein SRAE_2000088900 [Strongyloides ratti]|uniref:Uncharacterized protein n=1 Tax=Strongyloides ratti TaxID=34506 RepID=A0A090MXY0_STRRB|nr:Hypothetical protein SRAE_2000088900 [Strongyloides ratti]CEF66219.1 Hypothetical protein SRAE_2000088900 [Strongyloides ratti]
MDSVRKFLNLVGSNYASLFLFGASSGAAFELFKIKFTFMGFNYYTSFTRLQVPKELNAFEAQLKEKDDILMKKYEPDFLKNDSEKN